MTRSILRLFTVMLAFVILGCICVDQAIAQVKSQNGITILTYQNHPQTPVGFLNAKPMPMPINYRPMDPTQAWIASLQSSPKLGTPGHSPGAQGTGITSPILLGTPKAPESDGIQPMDFGTLEHPFSTARADLNPNGQTATNTLWPYRAAGKMWFKVSGSYAWCSASLIKRGVIVTAAHCVANYGQQQFYNEWYFSPGQRNWISPFGTWSWVLVAIKSDYYFGTDNCYVYGVVCPDDVAVIVLQDNKGAFPGTATGWYGYGFDGFGFASGQTHVTQLGYPSGLDNGLYMERNDSSGYVNETFSNNTVIGSNMNGGSSGGPWLVNFGIKPNLTGETDGQAPNPNIVVGVTSWGYVSPDPKEQGASPFTSNNVDTLVGVACSYAPAACQ